VLSWLKKLLYPSSPDDAIAHQPPGDIFPWPKGIVLTAVDDVTIALPKAIFENDAPIGDALVADDDALISIPAEGDRFYIRLQPGVSVSVRKSCQAFVVADDDKRRRVKIERPT
jgi:hypothetical protein